MLKTLPLAFLLFVVGCVSRKEPSPKNRDLFGKFVGDDGSYFVFTPDMKMSYHAIPAVWRDPKAKEEDVVSGSGEWRIEKDTILATVRDDSGGQTVPSGRKIVAFDVQGWFGLFLMIDREDGSGYALYYVPPEKMKKEPIQPPLPTSGLRPAAADL